MRILIATGIFPPDIGGPAKYAQNLADEFSRRGHTVRVLSFSAFKKWPSGIRHGMYGIAVWKGLGLMDTVFALDTFSAGFPALCAAKLRGKKYAVRIGGDFLWETYTHRTGVTISLLEFYERMPLLSLRERFSFFAMRTLARRADALVFNTAWQKNIFCKAYTVSACKTFVVENLYPPKAAVTVSHGTKPSGKKVFLWAGRPARWKNIDALKRAFAQASRANPDIVLEMVSDASHHELEEKFKTCWAIILPSLTEIGSNTILEALAFNVPFILTRETGLADRLADVGLLVDPKNKEDMADKILFLADPAQREAYVRKATNFRFTHSWEEIAKEFESIFSRI